MECPYCDNTKRFNKLTDGRILCLECKNNFSLEEARRASLFKKYRLVHGMKV